ncbi:MAG: type II toxin-antitoxin system VapC family toxin [Gemmatimonadota bacterium]
MSAIGKRRSLLDSYAILAFLNDERGAERVANLLEEAAGEGTPLFVNEINVGEVYYIVAKHRSPDAAEEVLLHLERLPLERVPNTFDEVLEAARLKARFPLSYADAFALASAIRLEARLVTGDPEFETVEHLVEVQWI